MTEELELIKTQLAQVIIENEKLKEQQKAMEVKIKNLQSEVYKGNVQSKLMFEVLEMVVEKVVDKL